MKLIHISKTYHNKNNTIIALHDISLTIENCGMTFILGPSGCGKTTLLNIISQKDHDYRGKIEINGIVERIEQSDCLFESMTVLDNLLLVEENQKRIEEYLKEFDLIDQINQKVSKLSGGQRKRVQVIRSFLSDFDYLVCDEPTAFLDDENTQIIMKMLKNMSKDKVIIIVTHEMALCDAYADRVISMEKGKIHSDVVKNDRPLLIPQQKQLPQKKHLSLSFMLHHMKSSLFYYGTKGFLFLVASFSILIILSLFQSVNKELVIQNKWLHSDNVILTQSKSKDGTTGDLYNQSSIQIVKDNAEDVIAYRYSWNAQHLSFIDIFTPSMTVEDIENAIMTSDQLYHDQGIPLPTCYDDWKKQLATIQEEGISIPKDTEIYTNLQYYDCFHKDEQGEIIIPNIDFNFVKIGDYLQNVSLFQVFDSQSLNLQYGEMGHDELDVVIDSRLAKQLYQQYSLSSVEELINRSFPLQFSTIDHAPIEVKITGITYEYSENDYRIYFKDGTLNQLIEDIFQLQTDYPTYYLYVEFLTDGKSNDQDVASQINTLLNNQKSEFVTYPDSVLSSHVTETKDYSYTFYIAMFCIILLTFLLYSLLLAYRQKRIHKELNLLKQYHYQISSYMILPLIIILISSIIIQIISLSLLSDYINSLAISQGYPALITNQYIYCFISALISFIIVTFIEGGFYVIKTHKHS